MNKIKFVSLATGIALMLATCVLFLFAGCGSSGDGSSQANAILLTEKLRKQCYIDITALVTLIVASSNLIISFSISKKTRHTDIASMRRKERIDNFIICYSKLSALVCPETVKTYVLSNNNSFSEKLVDLWLYQ